jgi:hypothetical protein
MGVRDEGVAHTQELARRQAVKVAEVEQKGTPVK